MLRTRFYLIRSQLNLGVRRPRIEVPQRTPERRPMLDVYVPTSVADLDHVRDLMRAYELSEDLRDWLVFMERALSAGEPTPVVANG